MVQDSWFRVSGFTVQDLGFGVSEFRLRGQGKGLGVQGLRFRIQDSGFRIQDSGFKGLRVQGLWFRIQGRGFRSQVRVQGSRCQVLDSSWGLQGQRSGLPVKVGGVNHAYSYCHLGEISCFDVQGGIRRCDWLTQAHFLYVHISSSEGVCLYRPIRASCFPRHMNSRNIAR